MRGKSRYDLREVDLEAILNYILRFSLYVSHMKNKYY